MSSTRGPLPKREAERAGHNAKSERADIISAPDRVVVPDPPETWHPRALEWYMALAASGQSRYFEPSDWVAALIVGDMLTSLLTADDPSAALFKAILAAMDSLGVTESARRRMRIEVKRPDRDEPEELGSALKDQFERLRAVADEGRRTH